NRLTSNSDARPAEIVLSAVTFRLADNSLGRPSVAMPELDGMSSPVLMHNCRRSVGPLCNFDEDHGIGTGVGAGVLLEISILSLALSLVATSPRGLFSSPLLAFLCNFG